MVSSLIVHTQQITQQTFIHSIQIHSIIPVGKNITPKVNNFAQLKDYQFSSWWFGPRVRVLIIMRPSSLGGGRILRRTLSVCLSVCPSVCLSVLPVIVFVYFFTVEPSYERTSKIEKLLFSLTGQRHVCTFRHAQRAAYRTAISAAQTCLF